MQVYPSLTYHRHDLLVCGLPDHLGDEVLGRPRHVRRVLDLVPLGVLTSVVNSVRGHVDTHNLTLGVGKHLQQLPS